MTDFVKGDPPPWLEEDMAAPITRAEFNALNIKMAQLTQEVRAMAQQYQTLVESSEPLTTTAHKMKGRFLPRGKYVGKPYEWVVENDPWYVQWLDREGKAEGLGFDENEIETACNDPRPDPRGRR